VTPVRSKRGKLTHLTETLRLTACGKRCDGWLCLTFRPEENPEYVDCTTCRECVEFN
jgi:hypothetical protein